MIAHAGRVLDGLKTAGVEGYNRAWQRNYGLTRRFRFTLSLQRRFGWSGPLAAEIATRFELLLIKERLLKDLLTYLEDSVAPLIGPDIAAELRALIVARMEAMHGAIEALELQYSDYAEVLRVRFLARMSLGLEEAEYRHQRDQTLISEEVYEDLESDLKRRGATLEQRPKLDLGLKLAEILKKAPLFAELKVEQVAQLAAYLTPLIAVPGQRIVAAGERGDRMYFIASGEVDVLVKPKPVRLSAGDFFGEIALLKHSARTATVIAVTECQLMVLSRDFLQGRLLAYQQEGPLATLTRPS